MDHQRYWIVFLGIMLFVILGYTTRTMSHIWQYTRLDQSKIASTIQWKVVSLDDEHYVLVSRYQFKHKEKMYEGETIWSESYLNSSTAQENLRRLAQSSLLIWYDSHSPEISTVQKQFPIKESIYTAILWILGLYFIGLGYYVNKRLL